MRKQATSRCLLALGIVSLIYVSGIDTVKKEPLDQFYMRIRPTLGHLPTLPEYTDIFAEYVNNVLKKNDRNILTLTENDWRAYRPTGEMCYDFLDGFVIRDYTLQKPFDIIPLDACLDWLFDNGEETKMDVARLNPGTKKMLKKNLLKDPKLKSIFEKTAFKDKKLQPELLSQFREYIGKLLKVNNDHPQNGCHSLWLETYDDFIEDIYLQGCDDDDDCEYFGEEGAENDPYLRLVTDCTIEASKFCYGVMQEQLVDLMRDAYNQDSIASTLSKKIKAATNKVAKQSDKHKWGLELIRILQLASATPVENPINLPDVVQSLNGLKSKEEETVRKFTDGISQYALEHVDLKDTANDPDGRKRFGKSMAKLCLNYIDKNQFMSLTGGATEYDEAAAEKKPFEFYNIINSIIRMTNHEAVYGVSKDQFEKDVIAHGWEALYLATFACQMISFTLGTVSNVKNRPTFEVRMRPNSVVLIADWPIEVMSEQLKPNEESSENVVAPPSPARSPSAPSSTLPASQNKLSLRFKNPLGRMSSSNARGDAPGAAAAATASIAATPASAPKLMSLETIENFKKMHGKYPSISPELLPFYYAAYPSLPKDLSGTFAKEPEKAFPDLGAKRRLKQEIAMMEEPIQNWSDDSAMSF